MRDWLYGGRKFDLLQFWEGLRAADGLDDVLVAVVLDGVGVVDLQLDEEQVRG